MQSQSFQQKEEKVVDTSNVKNDTNMPDKIDGIMLQKRKNIFNIVHENEMTPAEKQKEYRKKLKELVDLGIPHAIELKNSSNQAKAERMKRYRTELKEAADSGKFYAMLEIQRQQEKARASSAQYYANNKEKILAQKKEKRKEELKNKQLKKEGSERLLYFIYKQSIFYQHVLQQNQNQDLHLRNQHP